MVPFGVGIACDKGAPFIGGGMLVIADAFKCGWGPGLACEKLTPPGLPDLEVAI